MTTRKSNNNRKQSATTRVNQAAKTAKQSVHTWNATARAFQEPKSKALGRELLAAMNTLGVHVTSLSSLKAADFFTAWWGGLKDSNGNPQMLRSVSHKVTVDGRELTLYTLEESGLYKAVRVYEKRTILSETEKAFDKKSNVAPTTDVVVDGLKQCAMSTTWMEKAEKADRKAQSMTEGYVNLGTTQTPNWQRVAKSDKGTWGIVVTAKGKKTSTKSARKVA